MNSNQTRSGCSYSLQTPRYSAFLLLLLLLADASIRFILGIESICRNGVVETKSWEFTQIFPVVEPSPARLFKSILLIWLENGRDQDGPFEKEMVTELTHAASILDLTVEGKSASGYWAKEYTTFHQGILNRQRFT